MNIKNFVSNTGIAFGILLIYLGVMMFVEVTSTNQSLKNNTYISKVKADLKVYYDKEGYHRYGKKSITDTKGNTYKLYDGQWSSTNYPIKEVYKEVKIEAGDIPTLTTTDITTDSTHSFIPFPPPPPPPPVRHSH